MSNNKTSDNAIEEWWHGRSAEELNGIRANVLDGDFRYSGVLKFDSKKHEILLESVESNISLGRVSPTGIIEPDTYCGCKIPIVRMIGLSNADFWQGRFFEELIGVKVTVTIRGARRRGVLTLHDGQLTLGRGRMSVFLRDEYGFVRLADDAIDVKWNSRHGNGLHSLHTGFTVYDRDYKPIQIEYGTLKPCPFCGGNNLVMEPAEQYISSWSDEEETTQYQVRCVPCWIEVAGKDYEGAGLTAVRKATRSAAKCWNRRAN